MPDKDVISPDELLSALKRYLEESGDTEQTVASKIGMNHHTLRVRDSNPCYRRERIGKRETYLKIGGQWMYLYRAVDKGKTVESYLESNA